LSALDPHGLRLAAPAPERAVAFTFEGRTLHGVEGEPVAVALHAQGVHVLGRSMRHRRPRGLHCVADACPSCTMRVNGLPGVTTCVAPLRAGDRVERERGAPNADRDVLGGLDRVSALAPVGFQYRRFRRSPRMYARWERMLAHLAGTGALPEPAAARAVAAGARFDVVSVDVAVVGGGPAGLAAALAAARAGARVMLVERGAELGGSLLDAAAPAERARARGLALAVAGEPGIAAQTGATAIGWYAEGVLGVVCDGGLIELRAGAVVLASGAHERPLAFPENDRPGVLLGGGVRRLLHRHELRPGRRVVVVANEDSGYRLAAELADRGVDVPAVADARPGEAAVAAGLRARGIEVLAATTVRAARGRTAVRGVDLVTGGGADRAVACDTIAVANGRRPARELLLQRAAVGGLALRVPDGLADGGADPAVPAAPGWWLAGAVAGATELADALEAGTAAGRAAGARG
jgi:sarcosine oxidase subunit alpha